MDGVGAQQKKHPVAWEIRIRMHVRARLMEVSMTKASALHFIALIYTSFCNENSEGFDRKLVIGHDEEDVDAW